MKLRSLLYGASTLCLIAGPALSQTVIVANPVSRPVPVAGGAAGGAGNLTAATVKAPSTAAVATDTSLVIDANPGGALVSAINAAIPSGTNTIGGTIPTAGTASGATPASILSANSTNATNVKASAGTLYHISVQNNSTSALAYIIFFNTSSTPTCTGTPYYGPVLIPYVGSTGNNGSGVIEDIAIGLNFTTGISYCLTTAVGGTGSVAANQVTGGLGYK